jgi:hypothetical protein
VASDESDQSLLHSSRDRAASLLAALTADGAAFREERIDPAHADGAALCDRAAEDARQLLAALEIALTPLPTPTENERTPL